MSPLPRWAFGNQQSRWGYRSADEVLSLASQFRAQSIPCDAIYLDIDYMNGYRVFTWDAERFADPAGLIRASRATDAYRHHHRSWRESRSAFTVYQEGLAKGYFVRSADGAPFGLGLAWAELLGRFSQGDVRHGGVSYIAG